MSKENVNRHNLDERVKMIEMDATRMHFKGKKFDMVVNFTGLEDIHMTRGRTGVHNAFIQINKVLKSGGFFCFVVMLGIEEC